MAKPAKELKGFVKTNLLKPGEKQQISFTVNKTDLASFDESSNSWVVESGNYTAQVGASSEDIRQNATFKVEGETVEKVHQVLTPQVTLNLLKK